MILRGKITDKEKLNKYFSEIQDIERKITLFHAEAIKETLGMSKSSVDLIGFHGQTIFQNANRKISKQLGDAKLLSGLLRKKIIHNFQRLTNL